MMRQNRIPFPEQKNPRGVEFRVLFTGPKYPKHDELARKRREKDRATLGL